MKQCHFVSCLKYSLKLILLSSPDDWFWEALTFPHITIKGFIILVNCKAVSPTLRTFQADLIIKTLVGKLRDSFSYPLLRPAANMKPPEEKRGQVPFLTFLPYPHFQQPLTPAGWTGRTVVSTAGSWPLCFLGWVSSHSFLSQASCVGLSEAPLTAALLLKFPEIQAQTHSSLPLLPPCAAHGISKSLLEACSSPRKPL